jgi:hypothetical protein
MNDGERWRWSIYGTFALVVLSGSLLATDEWAFPVPLPLVILSWFFGYGFLFVFPLIYGVTSWILWPRPSFGPVAFWAVLVVGALNLVYFLLVLANWSTVQYKGAVVVGLIANITRISISLVLAAVGVGKGRRRLNAAAYLLLFLSSLSMRVPAYRKR